MHSNPSKSVSHLIALSITVSLTLPCFLSSSQYTNCKQPFKCGEPSVLGEVRYPFWGVNRERYCGAPGYELKCLNNTPIIRISTLDFQVTGTNPQAHKITVARAEFRRNLCPSVVFNNHSSNFSVLDLLPGGLFVDSSIRFLTILYGCPSKSGPELGWSGQYSCRVNNTSIDVHFVTHTVNVSRDFGCGGVAVLPISEDSARALDDKAITLPEALDEGFELLWIRLENNKCNACTRSGGQCGYNWNEKQFTCYCHDKPYPDECPDSTPGHPGTKIILVTVTGIVMSGFLILFTYYILRKCKPVPQNQSVEDFLKNYASLVPRRYTYASIKKMTNSFREKLGEGGYGAVFKGKLQDGRDVAVKVLKQSKCDGQEFVNEVVSTCRTNHINVIRLLGFCFDGHKRALVCEFMPNGSLEKFINGKDSKNLKQSLSFEKLFEIAAGVARGLEYLHRGCNTRILHFDIKPHNILLDAKYTPKISDFGLAKSCNQEKSIISMSGARGTAGYIAPELVLRTFGGVSHKSDVYSYGMMVLDMVGCRKRVDESVEISGELYFPQWIYKQLEQETELDGGILNKEDKELERKMILVGLWCIQTNPLSRPPMSRVVEMLEGKVELLEVPPVPSLSSPPRQQPTDDVSGALLLSTTI